MTTPSDPNILVLDDDAGHAASVRELLRVSGYRAEASSDAAGSMQRLRQAEFQILVLDINMPQVSGLDVLEFLGDHQISVKTIVLSGETAVSSVTPVLRLGAYDYLTKPYEPQQLLTSVANAVERHRLEHENRAMASQAEADHALHEFLVTSSPDLIYVLDDQGRFTFANKPVSQIFDAAPGDVSGVSWKEVVGPELAQRLRYHFNERRTGERATRHFEFEYRRGPESSRILEFSARGLYENGDNSGAFIGTYGVLRDVTEARLTARELAQSRLKFYGLFMDSPDASYIARLHDGKLLEANESFRRIQSRLDLRGSDTDAFLFPNGDIRGEFVRRLTQDGAEPKTVAVDCEALESVYHLELTGRALTLNDEPCLLATVHDRTDARLAERDRLNLQNRLQQASKMEAIGQLAGGIAHDFNNILASIIGYAELIRNSRTRFTPEQVDGHLEQVINAGRRARDLISQMLTFTRANRGDPKPVEVAGAIDDVSRMLRAAIPNNIDIVSDIEDALQPVHADPVQLQQIIINLLVNARDAIDGSGRILVRLKRGRQPAACAACGERLDGEHIVLSVTDSGHGIPDDVRERMFEMYFTTREPGKGTGIGLWQINNLIHEYQGHITLTSQPNLGTTFEVHLPIADPQALALADAAGGDAAEESNAGQIVVVDDEVSVGNFISEVLRDAGYDVALFHESPAALRHLQTHHREIGLLITDQNMPLMNGHELAEQAKALQPDLPVVLITGFASSHQAKQWRRLGLDGFLAKPFRLDELLDTVAALAPDSAPPARTSEGRAEPDPAPQSSAQ
ncbi:MAG: response regulator [Roseibium album]|uniref:response regulator n=1 Tax=Roseibium album TaxID=311410 RepID=UPI0032EF342C